ncbi:glutathione hydrolase 5 proenzyme-like isoform X2 [Xiphophorus maculatus]|uniref:glutathione hydrolase 5 proenzyme-like isoform X2 n=1 Tax=Xiphophorus maculatus TaxID=8083 RepID=UPI000C6EDD73|nr:glutathione hydrolase 5 proenzyme-like isoform X2 [Xiphophorus maculatus]
MWRGAQRGPPPLVRPGAQPFTPADRWILQPGAQREQRGMARSKARVYTCCALLVVVVIAIIVIITVTTRRRCADDTFSKAAVAADARKCSEIGRDMLRRGGSAVDGAIAALLCTGIMNPQSAGIGGGAIFTVMDRSGQVKIINSRETAPSKVDPDLLKSCPLNRSGSKWIGVPGEIRGYELAHKLYGKLPWAALFQPTIKLAREGFPIPPVQGLFIPLINNSLTARKLYSDETGTLLKTGDKIKFEKLADTLELIANKGAFAFYTGRVAEDLVRDVQQEGGNLTLEDLASYKATVTEAWVAPVGEYQMYIPPPPSGGPLLSLVLNIMKEYQVRSAPLSVEEKIRFYHRYVEAFKFANGLKRHIRDPRFKSDKMAKEIIAESFAKHIGSLISSDRTHDNQYYNLTTYLDSLGTTHVSVLAEDGSAVAVTSTINYMFGSKVYSPSTGIFLNNQLSDFCGRVDNVFPGEQPPSSMTPVVLKSKWKTLVIGASGGSMITTGLASALINHLWFGKSLKEAIDTPVVYVDSENKVKFEPKFDEGVIKALRAFGHKNETARKFYNVVNAVEKKDGCICAESDDKKLGETAGG